MTYIDLLNRFWEANRQSRFTTSERELYFYLLNEANLCYWRMPFSCPTSVVCAIIGLSRPSVIRAREGLTRRGFISFTEGLQNSKPPQYMLLSGGMNVTASVTAVVTAHETILKDKDKNNISIKNGKRKDEYTQRRRV